MAGPSSQFQKDRRQLPRDISHMRNINQLFILLNNPPGLMN
jgi:hypothetical protein